MNLIEVFYPVITKKLHYKQKYTRDDKITSCIVQKLTQQLWDIIAMYYNFMDHKISKLFKKLVLEKYSQNSEAQSIPTPVKRYISDLYIEKSWSSNDRIYQDVRCWKQQFTFTQYDTKIIADFKRVVKTNVHARQKMRPSQDE